jgi:acetyltransferase-like isoleucine patch superfamily enzyme
VIVTWWRLRGARIASDVRVLGDVVITGPTRNLTIGDGSRLNPGVVLNLDAPVRLGRDVHLSSRCQVLSTGLLTDVVPREHVRASVVLGDHVWVAAGAVVTAGVTVGEGAVVAANAVVTKDVAPYTLVGGTPAVLIRELGASDRPEP